MRIKHRVNENSMKMYDKQLSVLRVETTINNTRDFKVYRTDRQDPTPIQEEVTAADEAAVQNEATVPDKPTAPDKTTAKRSAKGKAKWRRMRKGVSDIHRRAQVCQAANERYLEAMASVADTTPLKVLTQPL